MNDKDVGFCLYMYINHCNAHDILLELANAHPV